MDLKKWRDLLSPIKKEGESDLEEISVFSLPMVLFPGSVLPLHIVEERYKLMTDDLLETKRELAMHKGEFLPGTICCGGQVVLLAAYPDGRKDIFVEGRSRFQIVKCLQETPYIRALAKRIPDIPYGSEEEQTSDHQKLSMLIRRWIFLSPDLEDRFIDYVSFFSKSHQLADFIAFSFLPSLEEKQRLLETVERKKRVVKIVSYLEGEIRKLESRSDLQNPLSPPYLLH
ncbi:MAG: LON peptidase substrate-binding domain-containing protein [Deltaproteobacteria bacterium]|nr:LON peptidase substrate-binding domain-containing protein [Deltaproteobacteria bacterium]